MVVEDRILVEKANLPLLLVLPATTLTHLLPDLRCNTTGRGFLGGRFPVHRSDSPLIPAEGDAVNIPVVDRATAALASELDVRVEAEEVAGARP